MLLVVVGLAVVLLAAAGCGGSSESADSSSTDQGQDQQQAGETTSSEASSSVELVQAAYTTTTQAKTAKVDLSSTVSAPSGSPAAGMNMSGQGVMDFANRNTDIVTQMGKMGDFETRLIGGTTMYMKLPSNAQARRGPNQKPWVKGDLDAIARKQTGASLSVLQGNTPNDPTEQFSYLKGVSDSVEEVGTEEVRGVPTTHYRATVDLKKAAAAQQQQGAQAAQQAYDKLIEQLGSTTMPVEVWLDEKGLLRRYQMSMPLPKLPQKKRANGANQSSAGSSTAQEGGSGGSSAGGGAAGGGGQMTTTEELYDFGTPVSVEAPPADQTADITELAPPAQQSGSS